MKKCHPKLIILTPSNCDSIWVLQKNVFPHFLILIFSNLFVLLKELFPLLHVHFVYLCLKYIGDEFYHIDRGNMKPIQFKTVSICSN